MPSVIAREMQALVRGAAEPVAPGETVTAQMRKSWERLGRPAWWRLKASWYLEGDSFSAQAVRDMQERFLRWREAEAKRAASAAETERLLQSQRDKALLEAERARHISALAAIETRLAVLTDPRVGDPG